MILLNADPSSVYALRFSPDGARLVAGTKHGGLTFFEYLAPCGENTTLLDTPVNAIDFSPSGARLAAATGLGWFARSDAGPSARPKMPSRSVTGVKFVSETLLAIGVGDRARAGAGQVQLFDVARNAARTPAPNAPEGVRALDANPGAKRLAWAEWGRRAGVWDTESAAPTYLALPCVPNAIALSPAADRVAVALKWDAAIYDLAARREQCTLKGHKGTLTSLAFAPDGRQLVTGSWDGTVKFWEAQSGRETASYDFGIGRITALALSPDGLQLAAGGEAGAICVFDVT